MIAGVTHMRVLKAQPEHDYALQVGGQHFHSSVCLPQVPVFL